MYKGIKTTTPHPKNLHLLITKILFVLKVCFFTGSNKISIYLCKSNH